MSKFTPEQYQAVADKYGIPCGPYDGKQTHSGTIEIRYVKAVGGVELCVSYAAAIGSQKLCDGFVRACESLPDLLIERDALKAENERLRKALSEIASGAFGGEETADHYVIDEMRNHAGSALKGGAA